MALRGRYSNNEFGGIITRINMKDSTIALRNREVVFQGWKRYQEAEEEE